MIPLMFFAEIVAASRQGLARPQVKRRHYITTGIAGLEAVTPGRPPRFADARRRPPRQLALGEGHAAKAPQIEMIERHRPWTRSAPRRAGGGGAESAEARACGREPGERAHGVRRLAAITSETFWRQAERIGDAADSGVARRSAQRRGNRRIGPDV
jgi:hypothetical protein